MIGQKMVGGCSVKEKITTEVEGELTMARPAGACRSSLVFRSDQFIRKANAVRLVDYFEGTDEVWRHLPTEVLYDEAPAKRPARAPAAMSVVSPAAASPA
ncbi:hypothetical protein PC118_g5054 [Phytophthora cactorum]|uniref:Uncharacterized protein n=1 Tax=Phytophthora cactorum TaxID=29920 RepID=A0A8T1G9H7_9STRA|nr:hypothetical protein PC118_g5054 [Phytophthora cactorum]